MTPEFYRRVLKLVMRKALILCFFLFSTTVYAGDLVVTVEGLRSNVGFLRLALFDQAKEFPRGADVHDQDVAAKRGRVDVVFKNIKPGTYAAAIHHDENANKSMDTNFIGLPEEGYGFSNNARVIFGPPTFEAASFNVGLEKTAISLKVVY